MNTILTVNARIFRDECLHDNSRRSFQAAASRWGCDYFEWTKNTGRLGHLHPACWKTMVFLAIGPPGFERALIVDADAVISANCPNPFETFPEEQLTVVTDRQTPCGARDKAEADEWKIVTGRDKPPARYFNSGVILASAEHHASRFRVAMDLCEKFPDLCWHDQTPFNVAFEDYPQVNFADATWNFFNPADRVPEWPRMVKNIYHFPGNPARLTQIPNVLWH